MAEKTDREMDSEIIMNMDFLMNMDVLEEEDSWELLKKEDSDPESLLQMEELSESEVQDDET
jgi:hypothetical protein